MIRGDEGEGIDRVVWKLFDEGIIVVLI